MEPVAGWLARLGLYTAAFAEADIDCEVLRDLSDADLEKLAVTLGHRKKLLRAIAELSERLSARPGKLYLSPQIGAGPDRTHQPRTRNPRPHRRATHDPGITVKGHSIPSSP